MSQSTILSATDSAEASQPELEASSDQGISLSDLSPPPAANDESDETPLALAKRTIKDDHLVLFMTWISENKMAVSGWVVALLSLVVTIIAMVPGFRSESMSQRALELAEWTALKDFIENCKQDHVGNGSILVRDNANTLFISKLAWPRLLAKQLLHSHFHPRPTCE
ncbi:Ff.00g001660.m01.CDS01 [Fusarium sp. VM40]|nr:Ff.00g001660.m01.CDS01 [Fusarium sp. VM40]